jgi:hypothetical protein
MKGESSGRGLNLFRCSLPFFVVLFASCSLRAPRPYGPHGERKKHLLLDTHLHLIVDANANFYCLSCQCI